MSDAAPAGEAVRRELEATEEHAAAVGDLLRVIGRSTFDLEDLLQTVLERAARLTHAELGNIAARRGDVYRVLAQVGFSSEFERQVRERTYRPERGSIIGRTLQQGTVVQIPDVAEDPEYTLRDLQRAGGYRSVIGVPMIQDGEIVGVMALGRGEVRPFDEAEIRLVSFFADQAAIAMRVANLLTETREALERERAVGDVLRSMSRGSFRLDEVFQQVIERAVELCRADTGNIARPDGDVYRIVAFAGLSAAYEDLTRRREYRAERGSAVGRTLLERRVVHIADVLADPEYELRDLQRVEGYRTLLGVPLLRDGDPIGAIVVARNEVRPFSEREIRLVQTFADQAVVAIEVVRLFQTVERQREELARFAPQVAALLSSAEGVQLLAGHRREITALFADLRGFTAFAESAEPEEVLGVLREYHGTAGELVVRHGGTVEHFAGDGLMAFFNDPTPVSDHPRVAVETAIELRDRFDRLAAGWRKRGYELGLGIGVAVGYATLGRIGFEGRYDYGAVGNVVILASRLSDAAQPGEILITQRLHAAVDDRIAAERAADLDLKGFSRTVPAFRVIGALDGPA